MFVVVVGYNGHKTVDVVVLLLSYLTADLKLHVFDLIVCLILFALNIMNFFVAYVISFPAADGMPDKNKLA